MNGDQALALIRGLLQITLEITGPMFLASLIAGVFVGILQTATQINEASISYAAKVGALIMTLVLIGPLIASRAVGYARRSFESIADVGR